MDQGNVLAENNVLASQEFNTMATFMNGTMISAPLKSDFERETNQLFCRGRGEHARLFSSIGEHIATSWNLVINLL